MTVHDIARTCHEANRALCIAIGDNSQLHWEEAQQWQRDSAVEGVQFKLNNPAATPEDQHESWSAGKYIEGWTHGPVKDADKKTHPCLVPYAKLPKEQQAKDALFVGIVEALKPLLG